MLQAKGLQRMPAVPAGHNPLIETLLHVRSGWGDPLPEDGNMALERVLLLLKLSNHRQVFGDLLLPHHLERRRCNETGRLELGNIQLTIWLIT